MIVGRRSNNIILGRANIIIKKNSWKNFIYFHNLNLPFQFQFQSECKEWP